MYKLIYNLCLLSRNEAFFHEYIYKLGSKGYGYSPISDSAPKFIYWVAWLAVINSGNWS